jgi:UDP-N-acetylmuramyl pentapeptide synthase
MSFLAKSNFYFKKPKVIIITGKGSDSATETVFQVLSKKLKVRKILNHNLPFVGKNEILIFETKTNELNLLNFIIKNSSLPILLITHLGEIPYEHDSFSGDKKEVEEILKFIKFIPPDGQLVLNFDDEAVKEVKNFTNLKITNFGFQSGSDFQATDIKVNHGTNFKLNYQGNTVPIWLDYLFGKEQIYSSLAAISVATIFNLNLVEASQVLKDMKIS